MMKKTVIISIIATMLLGVFTDIYAENTEEQPIDVTETETVHVETEEEHDQPIVVIDEDEEVSEPETEVTPIEEEPEKTPTTEETVVEKEPEQTPKEEIETLETEIHFDDEEDDTFSEYVDHMFYGDPDEEVTLATAANAYASLTANEKKFYNLLLPGIVSVAEGRQTSATFTVTFAAFGITLAERNTVWNEITNSSRKLAFFNALLMDRPFDCFWMDKTTGIKVSAGSTAFTFSFAVCSDFIGSAQYTVNSTKIASVSSAVTRAKNIVAKYKDKNDYDKLKGYANEICALTEYNYSAASSSTYGNPWNLIYVFDGNTSTKVVCEGYAKAFQYLCDLSKFDESITCVSVSGTCGGAHMFNIVRMSDGKNYLVDLTNCDSGSSCSYSLFLKPGSGSVANGYKVSKNSSSTLTYTYSTESKKYLSDYLTLSSSAYAGCAHSWTTKTTSATCTTKGSVTRTCSKCKKTVTDSETPALGHAYSVRVVPATCTTDGYSVHTCSRCSSAYTDSVVKATGHSLTRWLTEEGVDCTTGGIRYRYCTKCSYYENQTFEPLADHTWESEYTADILATCTADGSESIHCSLCSSNQLDRVIPAGHHYQVKVVAPTCTSDGYTEHKCIGCNDRYATDVKSALGHIEVKDKAVAATCTTAGRTEGSHCSRCNKTMKAYTVLPAKGHKNLVMSIRNATCTMAGYRRYTCCACGKVVKVESISAGHSYNNFDKCTKCGASTPGVSSAVSSTKLSSLKKAKGAFTVKWKKNKKVKGYQIKYSTSPIMANAKTVTISRYKTTSKKIKGARKTRYYVMIRTYKVISGKTKYSNWTPMKTVVTK